MKPFTFPFFESCTEDTAVLPPIEYSPSLHLQVLAGTTEPAIRSLHYDTETFTKAEIDTNENEHQHALIASQYLHTRLQTRAALDETESDFPQ